MTEGKPIICWFRRDLRVADNRALAAAAATDAPLVAVYVLDLETDGVRPPGGASRWWLHQSLRELSGALRRLGVTLTLRRGRSVDMLASLVAETGASDIYFSRAYEPGDIAIEHDLHERLGEQVELHRCRGQLLFEPESLANASGQPYRVFTPFYKAALREPAPAEPIAAPAALTAWDGLVAGDSLDDWQLEPTAPDWAGGLRDAWTVGATAAQDRLADFLDTTARGYKTGRDRPDQQSTSRLSPYLHFGEISPRQVWHASTAAAIATPSAANGIEAFLRELVWREFSAHLLFHWPQLPTQPLREEFERFPWQSDAGGLQRWQQGRTGYPMVDAGMRELWTTGWMHNRVRMIVASFLVKDLMIHWREGEAWFWDTLVDADLANNVASWQWVAGSGADAAPYFRVFNPTLQAQRYDPDGIYLRRWIPELKDEPDASVHSPRHACKDSAYPEPMVDHAAARERALTAYAELRDSKR